MTQAALALDDIYYPESDGKPMGETDKHRKEMAQLIETLDEFYAEHEDVYVSGDLLFYYEEGSRKHRAPDVFVVFGVAKGDRKKYLLWVEGEVPILVIEVTSESTKDEDEGAKKELYARLGVKLYFLYDPLGEYLDPSFQGLRLVGGQYEPMVAPKGGPFHCPELGLDLTLDSDGLLQFVDAKTGEIVPRVQEARRRAEARAAQEAARAAQEAARAAQEAVARRKAEAEIERLQARLRQLEE